MGDMSTLEIIKLLMPLIIIQESLFVYCLVNILRKGTRNLNKGIWILITITGTVGIIAYLLVGKKRWDDD
ncbi:MAG TPA: PLDc N-terminal domain-containing protein [Pseudobacteroides sp.]|nr:PLDc N-terminal domain-containing protein [Pseudobacteroides sp.]